MEQIHQCADDPVGKMMIPEQHNCATTNALVTCHLTSALLIENISYFVFRMTLDCRQWNETCLWWWLVGKFIITLSCNVIMCRLIITILVDIDDTRWFNILGLKTPQSVPYDVIPIVVNYTWRKNFRTFIVIICFSTNLGSAPRDGSFRFRFPVGSLEIVKWPVTSIRT
jgi:hypothetical protein